MKQLILIRHGEAEHLLERLVGGWTDTKLTEAGIKQAKCTGERLLKLVKDSPFNYYSSDLSRAKETAKIIGDVLGKQPNIVSELREMNNGLAANLSKEDAKKLKNPMTEPILDWVPYPEAESWNMMHKRLSAFLEKIQTDQHDLTVLVSHGNSIISLIHSFLGFSSDHFHISFDIQPCSITYLRINCWNEKTISKLNDISHLENEGLHTVDKYFT